MRIDRVNGCVNDDMQIVGMSVMLKDWTDSGESLALRQIGRLNGKCEEL